MKNSILILLCLVMISSCSIFRNKEKTKLKETIDSVVTHQSFTKSIDTSKTKSYQKLTLYFQPNADDYVDSDSSFLNFATGLMNAARGLAISTQHLKDSTSKGIKLPRNHAANYTDKKKQGSSFGSLIGAIFESGIEENKGKTDISSTQDSSAKKRDTNSLKVDNIGNSKMLAIGGVIALVLLVIIFIFVFRYIRKQ